MSEQFLALRRINHAHSRSQFQEQTCTSPFIYRKLHHWFITKSHFSQSYYRACTEDKSFFRCILNNVIVFIADCPFSWLKLFAHTIVIPYTISINLHLIKSSPHEKILCLYKYILTDPFNFYFTDIFSYSKWYVWFLLFSGQFWRFAT